MSNNSILAKSGLKPKNVSVFGAKGKSRPEKSKPNSGEVIVLAGKKLAEGYSAEAERILREALQSGNHSPDDLANLNRLLAYTLETLGRYKESIEIVKIYETEAATVGLTPETSIKVLTQLAICYNNLSDYPRAVTLLKKKLQ